MPSGGPRARKSERIYADVAADLRASDWSQKELAAHYRVSPSFVNGITANLATYGEAQRPQAVQGAPRKVTREIEEGLRDLIDEYKTVLLDEVVDFVKDEFDVDISRCTAARVMRRLNITHKRVTNVHPNQDPQLRDDFCVDRLRYRADQIVAVDESAADVRTSDRKYGWSLRGLPCRVRQAGWRGRRWSILPALTIDGYLAFDVFEGSFNAQRFKYFLIDRVLPYMGRFHQGEPRSVLLMDNASSHKSAMDDPEMRAALEEADVVVLWLPPYSPDFNPIEQSFNELKQWMRKHRGLSFGFGEYFEGFIQYAVDSVCPPRHARAYFRDCGFDVEE